MGVSEYIIPRDKSSSLIHARMIEHAQQTVLRSINQVIIKSIEEYFYLIDDNYALDL